MSVDVVYCVSLRFPVHSFSLSGPNIGDYLTELLSAASPHWPNLKKL